MFKIALLRCFGKISYFFAIILKGYTLRTKQSKTHNTFFFHFIIYPLRVTKHKSVSLLLHRKKVQKVTPFGGVHMSENPKSKMLKHNNIFTMVHKSLT